MSISGGLKKLSASGGGDQEQEFELNIAAIIDCFTVLITYLLASASFISIGIIDVTAATSSASSALADNAAVELTVDLDSKKSIRIRLNGATQDVMEIAATEAGELDIDALNERLKSVKNRFPNLEVGLLTAHSEVEYQDVVRAVDTARNSIPGISLGDR